MSYRMKVTSKSQKKNVILTEGKDLLKTVAGFLKALQPKKNLCRSGSALYKQILRG